MDEDTVGLIDEVTRPQVELFNDLLTEDEGQLVSSVSTTPGPSNLSNALKRKLQASSSSSSKRTRGDDDFATLVKIFAEKEFNVPGGKAKEAAIETFQEAYKSLDDRDFITVLDCFNNTQNVITFNALRPGPRRDAWVRHILHTSLLIV